MKHARGDVRTESHMGGMIRGSIAMMIALGAGAGCAMEEPRPVGAEHHAGEAADPAAELRTGTIATATGPMEIRYEMIDGHAVVEGDIVVPPGDFIDPSVASAATIPRTQRWPGGVIPYVIDPALPNQARVTDAINHWHQSTFIRLVPRVNQPDYVRFVVGTGCSSYVGRIGGEQQIWLHNNCSTGNTIHEIGHAVGLWHEQSRLDRDNHVTIHTQNIQAGYEHNFNKYGSGMDVGSYDIGSIMHYSSYAFSVNGQPTITTKTGGIISGQRNGLSATDRVGVGILYSNLASGDDMQPGEMLAPGQQITSSNGAYRFVYQTDGNLVLYRNSNGAALWASHTHGLPAGAVLMQPDGNLVIYHPSGAPLWASGTWGWTGSRLVMQTDGNAVIYTPGNLPVWATGTNQ